MGRVVSPEDELGTPWSSSRRTGGGRRADDNDAVAPPIRVLVVDDQQLLRTGFRVILESEDDIEVVGEAEDGFVALELAASARPDVVLMDIRMPRLDGLAATERLLAAPDPPRVVVLTTFDQNEYVVRALRAGAYGFLLKDAPASRLVAVVRRPRAARH